MSLLDIDGSNFENSLLIASESSANKDSINLLIENIVNKEHAVPTKLVTPTPGLCLKTFTKSGEKIFVNICHTEEVPYPKGNTIPMSIGNEKEINDKNDKPCIAFDVAINTELYNKNQSEIIMLTILEAVANKHGIDLAENGFRILRNIKCKGKIQPMNIEQRLAKNVSSEKPLISEIISKPNESIFKDQRINHHIIPDFNLLKVNSPIAYYASEIDLKNVFFKDEINLQVGEDRVFLTTNGKIKYKLEYHLPQNIINDLCKAEYNSDTQILTLTAPIQD